MLDVLRQGVSKGAALAEWASRRGIARENVMAIGDNWNDREMLEYAGVPVIMGNSTPELISSGWNVTLSNNESGVAAAIREVYRAERRTAQRTITISFGEANIWKIVMRTISTRRPLQPRSLSRPPCCTRPLGSGGLRRAALRYAAPRHRLRTHR